MQLSVRQIAALINAAVVGDETREILGFSSFDDAGKTDITFASDVQFLNRMNETLAGAVIVPETFAIDTDLLKTSVFLKTAHPKQSFFKLVAIVEEKRAPRAFIHENAVMGEKVRIGKDCTIEAGVVIEDDVVLGDSVHLMPNVFVGQGTEIGSHTRIKPNVTIMERTRIGSHVLIHSGSVIGSDGFGFTQSGGTHDKIVHTGFVQIKDFVEIGACNTIDRGTLGKTVIGEGVKTDNLVHIAHNVKVGDHTLLVAQVGIAGSAVLGKNVIVAGKAGISGHLKIGDNAIIGPYAGVHTDVPEKQIVSGIPQIPHARWRKVVSIIARLPEMRKSIFSFEKRLKKLEEKHKTTEKE